MSTPRPTLQPYLDAHPHDPARAVADYRAALAEWRYDHPRSSTLRPVAVGACLIVAGLLLLRALCGCSAPDPGPGDCAEACHAGEGEGTRALLDCVANCNNDNGDH